MHLMLENVDPKKRESLYQELTGPLRATGKLTREEQDAPAWWHGEDEAYESTMAALAAFGERRR